MFDKNGCALIDTQNNNNILARAKLRDNLYWVSNMVATLVAENATTVSNKTMPDDVTMWHNRLAHVNRNKISDMIRYKQLIGIFNLNLANFSRIISNLKLKPTL